MAPMLSLSGAARVGAGWALHSGRKPLACSCAASSASTRRRRAASLPQAAFRNEDRWGGSISSASWNRFSAFQRLGGMVIESPLTKAETQLRFTVQECELTSLEVAGRHAGISLRGWHQDRSG